MLQSPIALVKTSFILCPRFVIIGCLIGVVIVVIDYHLLNNILKRLYLYLLIRSQFSNHLSAKTLFILFRLVQICVQQKLIYYFLLERFIRLDLILALLCLMKILFVAFHQYYFFVTLLTIIEIYVCNVYCILVSLLLYLVNISFSLLSVYFFLYLFQFVKFLRHRM